MTDPTIARSAGQDVIRVEKMRAELFELGYSVVTTLWLNDVLADMLVSLPREKAEAVE